MNEIDLLFINEVEGAFFSGQIEPEAILDYFAKVFPHTQVILTLGDQGSCLQEGRERIFRLVVQLKSSIPSAPGIRSQVFS